MMNEQTKAFVRQHADDDIRKLALHGCKDPLVDMPWALDQIAGRQTARRKLPSWADKDGIVFPPHLSMEQCSSEATARYKAQVAAQLSISHNLLVDLTGGFGVDFSFMAPAFARAVYVERQEQLCQTACHNLQVLGIGQAQVVCCEAETFLQDFTERASLIFIDPARRDSHGQRTYAISDCTPDVVALLPLLLSKCEAVMLKLSPMLDWRKAVADLGSGHVSEVHIVATDGECKELLIVITPTEQAAAPTLYCTDDQSLTIFKGDELSAQPSLDTAVPEAGHYLYEPSATLMKSGCFAALQHRFDACQIATNSHLFVSYQQIADFPGRSFRILSVTSLNKRELQQALAGTTRANIAVRNFPLSAPELRKRLRLSDGGDTYIFATTLSDGRHVVIKGVKEV